MQWPKRAERPTNTTLSGSIGMGSGAYAYTFPHARARLLASPRQGKAGMAWHGMVW